MQSLYFLLLFIFGVLELGARFSLVKIFKSYFEIHVLLKPLSYKKSESCAYMCMSVVKLENSKP